MARRTEEAAPTRQSNGERVRVLWALGEFYSVILFVIVNPCRLGSDLVHTRRELGPFLE